MEDSSKDSIALGEPSIWFKLIFLDEHKNPTTVFANGKHSVKISMTVKDPLDGQKEVDLEVKGLQKKYRPDKEGMKNNHRNYIVESNLSSHKVFGAPASILTIFHSKFDLFRPLEHRVNVKHPLDVILYRT